MDIIQAIILAIVQGISAWIPIISKNQVIFVGNGLFGLTPETALAFALAQHIGDSTLCPIASTDRSMSRRNPPNASQKINTQSVVKGR